MENAAGIFHRQRLRRAEMKIITLSLARTCSAPAMPLAAARRLRLRV
jgi:hypothetical protein